MFAAILHQFLLSKTYWDVQVLIQFFSSSQLKYILDTIISKLKKTNIHLLISTSINKIPHHMKSYHPACFFLASCPTSFLIT